MTNIAGAAVWNTILGSPFFVLATTEPHKIPENIIETPHRHAVFTVPAEIRGKIYWNKRMIKDMSDRSGRFN